MRWKECIILPSQKTKNASLNRIWSDQFSSRSSPFSTTTIITTSILYITQPRFRVGEISQNWIRLLDQVYILQDSHSDSSSWIPPRDKSREAEKLNGLSKVTQLGEWPSKKHSLFESAFFPVLIQFVRVPRQVFCFYSFISFPLPPCWPSLSAVYIQGPSLVTSCLTHPGLWCAETWLSLCRTPACLLSLDCLFRNASQPPCNMPFCVPFLGLP